MAESETETTEAKYELSDLQISEVGMVKRGAVSAFGDGVNFFLLKSNQGEPMNDVTIEEVTNEPDVEKADLPIWEKVKNFVRGEVEKEATSKADPAALRQAVAILRRGGYNVTPDALAEMLTGEDEEESDVEMGSKRKMKKDEQEAPVSADVQEVQQTPAPETPVVEEAVKAAPPATDDIQKAVKDALAEVRKEYQDQIAILTKQAEDAKVEVAKAQEARERREWIEKADGMTLALPVGREEMGEHLHAIAKAAPAEVEWLVATFKAVDHALTESGLFMEKGTSRAPETLTIDEKARKIAEEKGIPLAKAYLELSREDQEALLSNMRGGK